MTCDEAKACFADDWCGMLRAPERDDLKRHLEDCAACRQEAERLESLWTKLDSLPAEDPPPQMRDRFYAALGAYGSRMAGALLPHGPVELSAYALMGALYLHGRHAVLSGRAITTTAATSVALLALAAVLETFVTA